MAKTDYELFVVCNCFAESDYPASSGCATGCDVAIFQGVVMSELSFLVVVALCLSLHAFGRNPCTGLVAQETFNDTNSGSIQIFGIGRQAPKAVLFLSQMQVDTDGAPDAYHPDNIGTTHICNALSVAPAGQSCGKSIWKADCLADYSKARSQHFDGDPRICFFAVVTNHGKPLVQSGEDPKPGYFISTTALKNPGWNVNSARAQLDSNQVLYIVLPGKSAHIFGGSGLGDLAAVYRRSKDRIEFAVVGDIGPRNKLGEGSIALHESLGNDPFTSNNGRRRATRGIPGQDVVYLLFPGSRTLTTDFSPETIRSAGRKLLDSFGGDAKLKACGQESLDRR
jgi:hypothetical protein